MRELIKIREGVDRELRDIQIVRSALDGTITPESYVGYLGEVAQQYAPHSPIVMCLAAGRCMNTHQALAAYLLKHAQEERGHNDWAALDLKKRRVSFQAAQEMRAVPACTSMIAYTYYLAEHGNPIGIFGWMYILEAVGADLGPEAAKGLRKAKLPAAFVAGHAEADQGHTKQIMAQIKAHIQAPADRADLLYAATVSAHLYVEMFRQCGQRYSDANGNSSRRSGRKK